jgi:hypothetical protein
MAHSKTHQIGMAPQGIWGHISPADMAARSCAHPLAVAVGECAFMDLGTGVYVLALPLAMALRA